MRWWRMLEGLVTTLLSLDFHGESLKASISLSTSTASLDTTTATSSSTTMASTSCACTGTAPPSVCRSSISSSDSSYQSSSISSSSSDSEYDDYNFDDELEDYNKNKSNKSNFWYDNKGSRATTAASSCSYHEPPSPDVDYSMNDTVFGAILRGELPARILAESESLLAFLDIRPRAPLHALIIPKAYIGSVFDLTVDDLPMLLEMQEIAEKLVGSIAKEQKVQQQQEEEEEETKTTDNHSYTHRHSKDDYRLCFHIPPFNSVDHLHLHVLAPVSEMGFYYKYVKYNPNTRWCIGLDEVVNRLQQGKQAVPYRQPPTSSIAAAVAQ